ncbi:MAG: hypothetical protein EPO68_03780 [Planctomycetota bacterium]|nr:MAG: hypothetical protein EPO68_03780 [Planctomycetota bacterium]
MNLAIQLPKSLALPQVNISAAYVVLLPGRGSARARSSKSGFERVHPDAKERGIAPNVLRYASENAQDGVSLGEGLRLEYTVDTERALPVYLVLRLVNGQHWRCEIDPATLVAGAPVERGMSLAGLLIGPRQYLEEFATELDRVKDHRAARSFFFDLDRRTNPQLVEAAAAAFPGLMPGNTLLGTRLATSSLMQALGAQLVERARTNSGLRTTATHEHLRTHATFISRMFFTLANEHFPERNSYNLGQFEDAFERFALGELAIRLPSGMTTTQPSSGYFVFFAEIGMFCMTAGIATNEWRRALSVLVRAQVPFFRSHTSDAVGLQSRIGDYGPHSYVPAQAQQFRATNRLATLRSEYAGLGIAELAQKSNLLTQTFLSGML